MTAPVDLKTRGREIAGLAAQVRALAGDDDDAFADTLDGETDVLSAASAVLRGVFEADAHAVACRALAASYMERARGLELREERLRVALVNFLSEIGEKNLRLPEGTISRRPASRLVVGQINPDALPDSLVRIKREPSLTAIKEALAAGTELPGLSLSNGGETLSIRRAR
ncbi:MAG: siphovirus Gp157 family protein [Caulobacter sp.]|nr:siphovirus Gp157 family protein [Caulobacter sp.]